MSGDLAASSTKDATVDPVWFASFWNGIEATEAEDGFPTESSSSNDVWSEEDCSSSREQIYSRTHSSFCRRRVTMLLVVVAVIVATIMVITIGDSDSTDKIKFVKHHTEDDDTSSQDEYQTEVDGGQVEYQTEETEDDGGPVEYQTEDDGGPVEYQTEEDDDGGQVEYQTEETEDDGGPVEYQTEEDDDGGQDEHQADGGRLEQWKFILGDANEYLFDSTQGWKEVTVPHSWNVHDGQNGGKYYRGPGWYQHQLDITNHDRGKRYFLRFQAVGTVAEVYVDQNKVTQHQGGYTAFATEITDWIHEDGSIDIRVKADNSYREDVAPLSGDFTVAGGMHRPVDLLVKSPVCLSPLDDASPGVRILQENVNAETASLRVNVLLDNGIGESQSTRVDITLKDSTSNTVASDTLEITIPSKGVQPMDSILTFENPHLWHGVEDPYLYTLHVGVYHEGKLTDTYTKRVGFRSLYIEPESGFYLNGKPYPLRGVNMHHDHQDMGAALTDDQIRKDFALVQELGANTVRLAHYPHSALSHEIADTLGFLLWPEIPLVNEMRGTPEFTFNARQQLMEMIKQLGNYHSVYTWGITNEMFQKDTDDPFDLLIGLDELAKEMDPSRFTIQATNRNRKDLNLITATYGINRYPGWYGTDPHSMMDGMKRYNDASGRSGLAIAEYGAGGSILHHSQVLKYVEPKGKWHPEEWQAYLHETQFSDINDYRPTWGSYIWLMFDFSSDSRNEGDRPGINDKGLITHDHTTKKDAFYFYQANWRNDITVVHLNSKRHHIRTEQSTPVKVYSNVAEVELFVNDVSIGARKPNQLGIGLWDSIELNLGENRILVQDTNSGASDGAVWTYDPDAEVLTEETSGIIVDGHFKASDAKFDKLPSMAFDDDPETRWATTKRGAWISAQLHDELTISGLSILWYQSTTKSYEFKVESSMDGQTWRSAYAGVSTKMKKRNAETYIFSQPEQARFVRIICYGSDIDKWSSIREVALQTK